MKIKTYRKLNNKFVHCSERTSVGLESSVEHRESIIKFVEEWNKDNPDKSIEWTELYNKPNKRYSRSQPLNNIPVKQPRKIPNNTNKKKRLKTPIGIFDSRVEAIQAYADKGERVSYEKILRLMKKPDSGWEDLG